MAEGSGWSAGKIVLAVVVGGGVLTGICCTAGYFANKDEIHEAMQLAGEGIAFSQQFVAGVQRFEAGFVEQFGDDSTWRLDSAGNDEPVLAIGLAGGTADADVEALQDAAWTLWVASFPTAALPLVSVGIGTAGERDMDSGENHQGKVHDWRETSVDVATLIERTGLKAPAPAPLLEHVEEIKQRERDEGGGVSIEVKVNESDD